MPEERRGLVPGEKKGASLNGSMQFPSVKGHERRLWVSLPEGGRGSVGPGGSSLLTVPLSEN